MCMVKDRSAQWGHLALGELPEGPSDWLNPQATISKLACELVTPFCSFRIPEGLRRFVETAGKGLETPGYPFSNVVVSLRRAYICQQLLLVQFILPVGTS
jgi:hypothetical protein